MMPFIIRSVLTIFSTFAIKSLSPPQDPKQLDINLFHYPFTIHNFLPTDFTPIKAMVLASSVILCIENSVAI
jgi:hypothetical protein